MLLSVLMSVYRSEKPIFLDRAMHSVWSDQTHRPDEIVLVEDGPLTESLYNVIAAWKRKLGNRLIVLSNRENMGLTKSLNKGLKAVSGKYVARMDSDDISLPRRFEMQLAYMESHPEVAVLGGALQEFNVANDCLNIRHYPPRNSDVLKQIYKASPCAHPAVMMRRDIFDNGLTYDERYRTSQDVALWYDVLCAGYEINNLSETLVKFRMDGDVFKRRSRSYAANEFKIYIRGIHRLYGLLTWRYVYPVVRLLFRLMPVRVIQWIYGSGMRKMILERKTLISAHES